MRQMMTNWCPRRNSQSPALTGRYKALGYLVEALAMVWVFTVVLVFAVYFAIRTRG